MRTYLLFARRILDLALGFLMCLISNLTFAQQQGNIWYMPSGIGLDFNTSPPTQLSNGQLLAQTTCGTSGLTSGEGEGVSSIADASGNLLFYTNGVKVYDKTHALMPALASADMMGNQSTAQSAIILPKPGNSSQYYIFTVPADPGSTYKGTSCGSNTPSDGLRSTIVDITLNSGNGDVLGGSLNTQITPVGVEVMEMLTAVPHSNGTDYWVICHGKNSNYYVYLVSSAGVSAATSSPFAVGYSSTVYIGFVKSNSCFNKLATTFYNSSTGIQVVDFNNTTGAITTVLKTFNTGFNTIAQVYGIEWSPNSSYLYCSELTNNYLEQVNYSTAAVTVLANTGPGGSCNRTCQLQIAPDGKIYVAKHAKWFPSNGDVTCLGAISNPDLAGATYNASAFCWTKGATDMLYVSHGLPQFTKGFVSNVADFTPTQICVNQATTFTGTYSGTSSNPISWDFNGDAVVDATNTLTPTYTYTSGSAGGTTYNVSLTVTDATCSYTKKITQPVMVYDMTPTYNTTGSCPGNITINATGTGAANFKYWDAASGGTLLATGSTYVVPTPYPKNVWVENGNPMTNVTAYPGPFPNAVDKDPDWTRFDILQAVTLKSVNIQTLTFGTCGGAQTIELRQGATFATSTLVTSKAVTLTCNVQNTLNLDFAIPVGTNYYLSFTGNPDITRYNTLYGGPWANPFIKIYNNGSAGDSGPFYDWVIWQANPCASRQLVAINCAAPVTLVDFFAEKDGAKSDLNWTTASERNNNHFNIQRSENGLDFITIGTVAGNGNSGSMVSYSFTDNFPISGKNYYRLVQVDNDGSETISEIILVNFNSVRVTMTPNPFQSATTLSFPGKEKVLVKFMDISGRLLETYTRDPSENQLQIGSNLTSGSYLIQVISENAVEVFKVIKE